MILINKTIVAFRSTDEYAEAMKFKAQHQDWKEHCDSTYTSFEKEEVTTIEPKKNVSIK